MSSFDDDLSSTTAVSKARISPLKDSPLGTNALRVTVEKMSSRLTDENASCIPDANEGDKLTPTSSDSLPVDSSQVSSTRTTMTDASGGISHPCENFRQLGTSTSNGESDLPLPCVKHAALNISRKASDIPSEKINLCNSCSKSMLSYIFLVQDFLDSLAREICGEACDTKCVQCAREESRGAMISGEGSSAVIKDSRSLDGKDHLERARGGQESKHFEKGKGRPNEKRPHRGKNQRKHDESKGASRPVTRQEYANQQCQQIDFLYNVSSPSKPYGPNHHGEHPPAQKNSHRLKHHPERDSKHDSGVDRPDGDGRHHDRNVHGDGHQERNGRHHDDGNHHGHDRHDDASKGHHPGGDGRHHERGLPYGKHRGSYDGRHGGEEQWNPLTSEGQAAPEESEKPGYCKDPVFISPDDREKTVARAKGSQEAKIENNFSVSEETFLDSETDCMVTTLSNVEREVYDMARNGAGWENLGEMQERLGFSSGGQITSEAFVTSCRNNAEAVGCLVVGTSLLLSRTSRTLCVLVSDAVSTTFRGPLSAVFQVVQYVRSLDSLGTTKLALLEQPDLGITFDKLNVWRLVQFSKCIYLNPDTLVIQNCDELFCHEELSAVPDIGWPDCFNSGVFVFVPSVHTFWQLIESADKQGSYDGGDQGLLNSYFSSWSYDIHKKLSFIYNLMANVSYTYTPAFRQFGRSVKIVQFHGSFKPWHVKFFTDSGQISPSSPVHPTYVQFVHIWISIFRISVLRLMSREIQSYAASQSVMCAVEVLRFFPSQSGTEFFLTPPSVRLRSAEKLLHKSLGSPVSEAQRRKSAEFSAAEEETTGGSPAPVDQEASDSTTDTCMDVARTTGETQAEDEGSAEWGSDKPSLPGSEVGDYQGMKAWEQGRMDYQGTDSSDNIIKRLQFLMARSK